MILVTLALAAPPIEAALRIEMDRARTGLTIPGRPAPYLVLYDVLDGNVTTAFAEFGHLFMP